MFGLTTLGTIHTAFSLIAVAAGVIALLLYREISPRTVSGRLYIWTTILVSLTGLGIFQHGGFGKPHALAVMALLVLGLASIAGSGRFFGRGAPYVEAISYSLTFFFHMVPGLTETFSRLPIGAPYFSGADDPALQQFIGLFLVLFLVGAGLQVRRIRAELRDGSSAAGLSVMR